MTQDRPEPKLDELRKLIAFARHGEVAATATELGVDPATISRRLAVFKQDGGDGRPVLEKIGGQLRLSRKGETVLPAVRQLVRQYEQLLDFLAGTAQQPRIVRLAIGHFAARHYLPRLLVALQPKCTEFAIEPHILRGRDRIFGVASGEYDVAIVTHDPLQIDTMLRLETRASGLARLLSEPLNTQPLYAAAHPETPAGRALAALKPGQCVPEKLLAEWEFVGLDETAGIRRFIQRKLRNEDLQLRFVPGTGVGGWPAAKEFARSNVGVAILPELEVDDADQTLVCRKLQEYLAVTDHVIVREGVGDDPVVGEVVAALRRVTARGAMS